MWARAPIRLRRDPLQYLALAARDGYHVGIAYDPEQGFAAGGDPLGMCPLYHASLPDGSVLVATSPPAFTCHPAWSASIDRTGLAGILLADGVLDDRPLMTGARRVAAGHRLHMPHQEPLRKVEVFEFAGTAPLVRCLLRDSPLCSAGTSGFAITSVRRCSCCPFPPGR
jgi:hypothetical protein